jgi:hypothetical protein
LVNLKTKSAGDGYPRQAIEKPVLRFLGSRTFSHSLGRIETLSGDRHRPHLALGRKSRPLISIFPSSVNWRRRSFRSAMLSNRVL